MTISKIKVGSTEHDLKAASADKLNTNAGSTTQPIYFADGVPKSCTYALNKTVPSDAVFTDTKNTAGSTNTSSKIFLVGATSQAANPQTYSHDTAYVGTDGYLYSNSTKVNPRIYATLVPEGTAIPASADLNTVTYLKVGNYYCSSNATVQTLKNCPLTTYNSSGTGTAGSAFMMQVYSPLSPTFDDETTGTWRYRIRKIIHYNTGIEYTQYCYVGGTAGSANWVYGDWYVTPRSSFTFNKTATSTAAIGSATNPVYVDSTGTIKKTTYTLGASVPSGAKFTDTTYTFATGDSNGQIKVTPSGGSAQNISVKGLGSAAYTNSADYLTKANPTGTGSLSMNRKASTTVGSNSVAVGSDTTASGNNSHAEGYDTTASGNNSHAEGHDATASGGGSHAEGYSTTASGDCSHAEGYSTIASGLASHASGWATVAGADYQFVIGKNNELWSNKGEDDPYAFVIGNGDYSGEKIARSNAFTVKWDGTVEASKNFIVQNGVSYSGFDTNHNRISLLYLSDTDNIHIGSDSETSDTCHAGDTYVNAQKGNVYLLNKNRTLAWYPYNGSNDYDSILRCQTDAKATCGSTSYRWYKLYAATTAIGTSDEREKSDIMSIEDYPVTYSADNEGNVFEQLFDKLTPKTYTLNVESTGEIRIGFIAQDIVKSLEELGLSEGDLGIIDHEYWTDEETGEEKDRYGLAYTEFIALNTYMIQKQKAKIQEQQTQIESLEKRIAKLEQLISA